MDGWKKWLGKKVYVERYDKHPLQGTVTDIRIVEDPNYPKIVLGMIDKFQKIVEIDVAQIESIKEEN